MLHLRTMPNFEQCWCDVIFFFKKILIYFCRAEAGYLVAHLNAIMSVDLEAKILFLFLFQMFRL